MMSMNMPIDNAVDYYYVVDISVVVNVNYIELII